MSMRSSWIYRIVFYHYYYHNYYYHYYHYYHHHWDHFTLLHRTQSTNSFHPNQVDNSVTRYETFLCTLLFALSDSGNLI